MKMSDLVEHVSKKPVPPYARNILVEVMCNDVEGEDVEVSMRDEGKRRLILIFVVTGPLLFNPHLREEDDWNYSRLHTLECSIYR